MKQVLKISHFYLLAYINQSHSIPIVVHGAIVVRACLHVERKFRAIHRTFNSEQCLIVSEYLYKLIA
jgi:hypothetical protein